MDHDEIVRLYGPWHPHTVDDAVGMFADYDGRWWIAGGRAIEAYTGVERDHGDIDIGIPRDEIQLLREHVREQFDVWAADRGTLRPLTTAEDSLPPSCNNLWLRPSGADPWEYDAHPGHPWIAELAG